MSRSILLPIGADLIGAVSDLIERQGNQTQDTLVIFPSRRPKAMLFRELSRRAGKNLMAPFCYSIGDFIEHCAKELGCERKHLDSADGAALIYELHPERQLLGSHDQLPIEAFLSWGFTLFSDFEELRAEGITPEALESIKGLAEEPLPPSFGNQLKQLGKWYREFYLALESRGLSTEASKASLVAEKAADIDLSRYHQIIVAGFYAVTGSEQKIIKALLSHANAILVLRDGPGIEHTIRQLGVEPERIGQPAASPQISYLSAGDSHGQVLALDREIKTGPNLSETVLVLNRQDTVFPIMHHLLPKLGRDWNISMGYPLSRTPLYSLIEALALAHESRENGYYFLPHYLKLMLHPYIKNISLQGASYPVRILLHSVEETLNGKSRRLIKPEEIFADPEVRKEIDQRLAGLLLEGGLGLDMLHRQLEYLHNLVLKPFEEIDSVADFARKLSEVISAVARDSTAGRHPFADRFFYRMNEALSQLEYSLLAGQKFNHISSYFALLGHYAYKMTVPFPGSSRQGLQVLGFMETRNLNFKKVIVLDANEGDLPATSGVDTILPQPLRRALGLPTVFDRELNSRYHFRNLLSGAEEVLLCYSQGEGQQKSRFLEELEWEQQKKLHTLTQASPRLAHFRASFSQTDPEPITKTRLMMETIFNLKYSATMLDCYLDCGLRFCYRYLMRIREKEETSFDMEASQVGKLVHQSLRYFWENHRKVVYSYCQDIEKEMKKAVDHAFLKSFGRVQDGGIYLIKSQVKKRLLQLLSYHSQEPPRFSVEEVELALDSVIDVPGAGAVSMFGVLDRVDNREGEIVIVDYKTGSGEIPSYEKFISEGREQWPHWLRSVQLPFYIMLYLSQRPDLEVSSINSELMCLGGAKFERKLLFPLEADKEKRYQDYRGAIYELIREIRDPERNFSGAAEPLKECPNCPYQVLCGRQWVKTKE